MKKTIASVEIDDHRVRHSARIESDQCPPPPDELTKNLQYYLFRAMVDQPELMKVGSGFFKRLNMLHDGSKWVIIMESIEDKNTP